MTRARAVIRSTALATAAVGLGAIPVLSTGAPAQASRLPPEGCSITTTHTWRTHTSHGQYYGYLSVRFPTTCGYQVKAFLHDPSFFHTIWHYGKTVRGTNQTSSLTTSNANYCSYGYEVHDSSGWHRHTLAYHPGYC